jgi:hypothetical protein
MKQTAVEWLAHQLNLEPDGWVKDLIEQAKEMEKEQIMQGYMEGLYYDKNSLYTPSKEQYYTETYGKDGTAN